jgi:hypothetical protein
MTRPSVRECPSMREVSSFDNESPVNTGLSLLRRCMSALLLALLLRRVPTVNQELDALTLVLECRVRKALPATLLARAGEVGLARCQLLPLAVEGDLREVSHALDVDEHAYGLDRARRRRNLLAGCGERRGRKCVGRSPVRIRSRRDVIAAKEEQTRRGHDVEPGRATLTLGRARQRERRRLERLATHTSDVGACGRVRGRRAVLLQVQGLRLLDVRPLTQPVLPGSNTPGTSAADAETATASAVARTPAIRNFFIVGPL